MCLDYYLDRAVLLDVVLHLDDPHVGEPVSLESEVLDDPPVVVLVGVDRHELDLLVEVLGSGQAPGHLHRALEVVGALVEEEQQVGLDESLEDLLGVLVVELHHQGDGVPLDELQHRGLVAAAAGMVTIKF